MFILSNYGRECDILDMKKVSIKLKKDYLHHILNYDEITGLFFWNNPPARKSFLKNKIAGNRTFCHKNIAYWEIHINNTKYYAHRLAWMYVYGFFPKGQIDHIDGNTLNNAISNLRVATQSQNNINKITKGYSYFPKRKKPYMVSICVNNKKKFIGYYASPQEAQEAYINEYALIYGEEWVSRKRLNTMTGDIK